MAEARLGPLSASAPAPISSPEGVLKNRIRGLWEKTQSVSLPSRSGDLPPFPGFGLLLYSSHGPPPEPQRPVRFPRSPPHTSQGSDQGWRPPPPAGTLLSGVLPVWLVLQIYGDKLEISERQLLTLWGEDLVLPPRGPGGPMPEEEL